MTIRNVLGRVAAPVLLAGAAVVPATPSGGLVAQDRSRPAPIEFIRTIGTELGSPELEFGWITGIAFLPGERLAVGDVVSTNVRVFTLAGERRATLGRGGGGPGEFVHPGEMVIDTAIHVFDPQQHRVVTFSFDGLHLGTTRLPTVPGHNITRVLRLATGQVIGATTPGFAWGQPIHQTDVVVVHLRTDGSVDTLIRYHQGPTVWYTPGRHAPFGLAFSRFGSAGAWAARGSVLAVADGYAGVVRYLEGRKDGSLSPAAEVRLEGTSRPVRDGDLPEVEAGLRALHSKAAAPPLGKIGLEPPPRWSIGQAAFFAGDGTLWVKQEVRADSSERWTLVTPEGAGESWVFPPGLRVKAVHPPYLAAVRRLESEVQVVALYRLPPQ
jgi:hypothetical protein